MLKRIVGLGLSLLLFASLVACNSPASNAPSDGSNASNTDKTNADSKGGMQEITVFGWGGESEVSEHESRIALFNKANEGKIHATLEMVPSQDFTTKLNAMFTAGNAHDVIMQAADYNGFYYRTGNFNDLSSYVERDKLNLDELLFKGIDNGNVHGTYREALPFVGNTMVVAYNKDMFDAAKVAYPQKDWTWDEFVATCKAMTHGTGPEKVYALSNHWATTSLAPSFDGGALFDLTTSPAKMMANDPKTVRGVEMFTGLIRDGYMPDPAAAEALGSSARFFAQQSSLIFFFNWDANWFSESIGDSFKWDFVDLPKNESGESRGVTWTTGLAMNSASKKKDAAWEFIKFFCLDEECNRITMKVGMPVLASLQEEYSKSKIGNTDATCGIFIDAMATSVINPLGGTFNKLGDEYSRAWTKIITEGVPVQQAMDELQTVGQPILEELTKNDKIN